jgi:hypothetical protein
MSANNPEFKHVDGAPYELPDLIKRLGDVSFSTPLPQERLDMVDAIKTHARNVQELILDGIESVGHLMTLVGCGDLEVENGHITQLGALLKHLASETNFLRATEGDMHQIIKEQQDLRAAGKKAAAGKDK